MPASLLPGPPGRSAVEDSLLGIKTSAAFLSSLGNNLRLDSSSPSPRLAPSLPPSAPLLPSPLPNLQFHVKRSPLGLLLPHSSTLPPPSLPVAPQIHHVAPTKGHRRKDSPTKPQQQPSPKYERLAFLQHDDVHDNHFRASLTQDPTTVQAACDLLSTSVASQSHLALRALLLSPLGMLLELLILAALHRTLRAALTHPAPAVVCAALALGCTGVFALLLLAFALGVVRPFRAAAAGISPSWTASDDVVVVTSPDDSPGSGARVLGVLVLEYRTRDTQVSKQRRRRTGRGLVRAWAVAPGARRQGVGSALLAEAVRVTAARGGDGVWFAEQHAHALRVLPRWCGGGAFEKRDRSAQERLGKLAEQIWGPGAGGSPGSGGCVGSTGGTGGKRSRASSMRV